MTTLKRMIQRPPTAKAREYCKSGSSGKSICMMKRTEKRMIIVRMVRRMPVTSMNLGMRSVRAWSGEVSDFLLLRFERSMSSSLRRLKALRAT